MNQSDLSIAHGLARLGLGINIALHGLVRLPDLPGFASGMQKQFAESIVPPGLVYGTSYGIALAEAIIGLLLVVGFLLRPALIAGTLLMIFLIGATCLIQNWSAAGIQMHYLAFYCVVLATVGWDRYSIDYLRQPR